MLLMVEKRIREGIFPTIHRYTKANKKYLKCYTKSTKQLSYLKYWDVKHLYDCAMSQKDPVNNFEWTQDTF